MAFFFTSRASSRIAVFLPSKVPATSVTALRGLGGFLRHLLQRRREVLVLLLGQLRDLAAGGFRRHREAGDLGELLLEIRQLRHVTPPPRITRTGRSPPIFGQDETIVRPAAIALLLLVAAPAAHASPQRVLFVGNSLTAANDLPATVAALARAAGRPIETDVRAPGGFALEDHWTTTDVQQAIADGHYDVVVLQQGPTSLPESRVNLLEWGRTFAVAIRAAGGRPAFFTVWPESWRSYAFDAVIYSYPRVPRATTTRCSYRRGSPGRTSCVRTAGSSCTGRTASIRAASGRISPPSPSRRGSRAGRRSAWRGSASPRARPRSCSARLLLRFGGRRDGRRGVPDCAVERAVARRKGMERPQRAREGRRRRRGTFVRAGMAGWSLAAAIDEQIAAQRALLDAAGGHGLRCWLWLGDAAELPRRPGTAAAERLLAKIVDGVPGPSGARRLEGRSTSRATRSAARTGSPPAGLVRAYKRLKQLDPATRS